MDKGSVVGGPRVVEGGMGGAEAMGARSGIWESAATEMQGAVGGLDGFRRPGGANGRLAHWEPSESSLRWFNSYLMLAAITTPVNERQLYEGCQDTDIGDPVSVVVRDWTSLGDSKRVNLDYLYSAEELGFLNRSWPEGRSTCTTVVEVGAGFGRTAHAILKSWPAMRSYIIVDLQETLALSRAYLHRVLPAELLDKCTFVDAADARQVGQVLDGLVDLAIQVDGLQEMPAEVIDAYFDGLFLRSDRCFFSTPIGKYTPESAGLPQVDPRRLQEVMSLGRCRSVVDPWDEESLGEARDECLLNYRPAGAAVVAAEPSRLRPHYLHALYQNQR